jgi:hypothetical protein
MCPVRKMIVADGEGGSWKRGAFRPQVCWLDFEIVWITSNKLFRVKPAFHCVLCVSQISQDYCLSPSIWLARWSNHWGCSTGSQPGALPLQERPCQGWLGRSCI